MLLIFACVSSPPATSAGSFTLEVERGYGDGTYPAGQAVRAWADVDPQAAFVTGWQSDAVLDQPTDWNVGFVMPAHDLVLTPTVVTAPVTLERRTYTLPMGDRSVLGVWASNPVGVVLFFHGASYDVEQLRDNAAMSITMQLAYARYTVVGVPSEAELAAGTGGWQTGADTSTNPDLATVAALVEALRADGTLAASTPLFTWGMSSGGTFAHRAGDTLQATGVAAFCAAGDSSVFTTTPAATAWFLAEADSVAPTAVADATAAAAQLDARGVPGLVSVHPATPLYDARFTRVAGIDAAHSAQIAEKLRSDGWVDGSGAWTASGTSVSAAFSDPTLSATQLTAVKAEIEIMAAEHELYDEPGQRLVAWFDAAR